MYFSLWVMVKNMESMVLHGNDPGEIVPVFLRGGIPQGQKRAGEGNGPQGTRVALTFVLSTFHQE